MTGVTGGYRGRDFLKDAMSVIVTACTDRHTHTLKGMCVYIYIYI